MSITLRVSYSLIAKLKDLTRFQSSLKWVLLFSFILAFIIRLIPELFFPVPVGFDTAIYIAGAKYNPVPRLEFRLLQKFILPYIYHVLKIDLLSFMKVYAPLVHALTTMLLVLYAVRVLSWSRIKLLVLILLLSLTPGIIRMTWDTHSQNLATLMLAVMLVVMGGKPTSLRFLAILPIMALIALTHQLVTMIALAVLFIEVFALLRNSRRLIPAAIALMASILIAINLNPVINLEKILTRAGHILSTPKTTTPTKYDLALQGLVVTWYIAPIAIIGLFKERRLLTWAITSTLVFLAGFLTPNPGPLVPGRWITYSSIPLAFFAANSASASGIASWKRILSIIFVILILSTGIGMLLPSGTPITTAMHEVYPEVPQTLTSSTCKKEHVEAIMELTTYLNTVDRKGYLVTHYPWFFWWSWYFYKGKTLYNGPTYTDEQHLKTFVESMASRYEKIYIIWFTGLTWAKELRRSGELALYEYELRG